MTSAAYGAAAGSVAPVRGAEVLISRRGRCKLPDYRLGISVTVAQLTLDQLAQVRILDPQLDEAQKRY